MKKECGYLMLYLKDFSENYKDEACRLKALNRIVGYKEDGSGYDFTTGVYDIGWVVPKSVAIKVMPKLKKITGGKVYYCKFTKEDVAENVKLIPLKKRK